MNTYIIYKLTFPSGKTYVGQTCNISRRFSQYKTKQVKRQPFLQNCLEKYDWNLVIKEILHTNLSKEEADIKEIEEISKLINSVNIASGGKSGLVKPIIQFDLDGNFIKIWSSVLEVCNFLKVPYSRAIYIGEICRESNKVSSNRYKDFLWLYKNLYDSGIKPTTSYQNKAVYQLDINNDIIKEHKSISEACIDTGISYINIKQAMYRDDAAGGYFWIYKDLYNEGKRIKQKRRRHYGK